MALLWAHQYDPPPPLSEQRPDLPDAVDGVLAKALAKSPDDRYDSCLRFVAALRAATAGIGERHAPTRAGTRADAPSVEPGPPPPPPRWALPVFRGHPQAAGQ
jgi:serine/threonine-protein kinase